MPISATCPSCKGSMKVNESLLGKSIRCPKCKSVFKAPAPAAAPPSEPDFTEEPLPPKPAQRAKKAAKAPSARVATCDSCDGEMLVREADLDEKIRCPHCERRVAVSDETFPDLPAAEDDSDIPHALTGPAPAARKGDKASKEEKAERVGWNNVKMGLIVVLLGVLCAACAIFIGGYLRQKGGQSDSGTTVLMVGILLASFFTALGHGLCSSVPKHAGGKGLATTSRVLSSVSLLFAVFLLMVIMGVIAISLDDVYLYLLAYLGTGVLGTLMFIVFLTQLALHLGAKVLNLFLWLFGILYLGFVGYTVVLFKDGSVIAGGFETRESAAILRLSVIGLFVYYLILLILTRVIVGLRVENKG